MTMQDSYLPLECTPETTAECTFCSNAAVAEYSVNYPKTGVVDHCRSCAIEYGVNQ